MCLCHLIVSLSYFELLQLLYFNYRCIISLVGSISVVGSNVVAQDFNNDDKLAQITLYSAQLAGAVRPIDQIGRLYCLEEHCTLGSPLVTFDSIIPTFFSST